MTIFDLVFAVAWPPVLALIWTRIDRAQGKPPWIGVGVSWAAGGIGVIVGQLPFLGGHGSWQIVLIGAAQIGVGIWLHRRRRRKRRRAAGLLGAKSRALRDAMVRKVRETAQPRRVLRPVPQGAWLAAP